MRITLEIPDELLRQADTKAVLEERSLDDLVVEGLRLVLASGPPIPRRVGFPIIQQTPGEPLITKELVDEAERQMLEEEAERYAKFMRP